MRSREHAAVAGGALLAALLFLAAPAHAGLASLQAACAPRTDTGTPAPGRPAPTYVFCDDGVPSFGGTNPNPGAQQALAVPERYAGYAGLPPRAAPDPNAGADQNGDVALDADVTLPDPRRLPRPPGGYPLMVMMHTCCAGDKHNFEATTVDASGEQWHYNNVWFATRGYVVLNYTSRGFVDAQGHGSTGQTQLDSRNYEVNDYQDLACQLAGDRFFGVDPSRVVITGSSYGGGLAWLAVTDPTWNCATAGHPEINMRLAAAAPKYGWTDLLSALVPNGSQRAGVLPPTDPGQAASRNPFGFPRESIVAALYATGRAGQPPTQAHVTFPPAIDSGVACLLSTDPFEQNPLCSGVFSSLIDEFLRDRSAYYQNNFFDALRTGAVAPVPVFSAGSMSSPLFTQIEHRRMVDRLESVMPGYPVQEYYGDYGDFTQSKAKEWGDLCGQDHHVCAVADYPRGDLNADPPTLARLGVTTRLDRFLDYYARPPGDQGQPEPARNATVALTVCPANASAAFPADEPGQRLSAPSFAALAPRTLHLEATGAQSTANKATPNPHAVSSDPIGNFAANGAHCPVETSPAGPGVATYDFPALSADTTMIGSARITVPHTGTGTGLQLNARLYDLFPDGRAVLVDRGGTVVRGPNATTSFDLNGNAWRFPGGHRLRIELAQDDEPYVKASNQPSSLTLGGVALDVPVAAPAAAPVARGRGRAAPCSSRQRFRIPLPAPRGDRLRSARVEFSGRRARVLRGRRWRAVIDLRGLPSGPVRVRIVARTRSGRVLRRTRLYRSCPPAL